MKFCEVELGNLITSKILTMSTRQPQNSFKAADPTKCLQFLLPRIGKNSVKIPGQDHQPDQHQNLMVCR